MLEVREPDDVTKHRAVRVDPRGIPLKINPTQVSGAELLLQGHRDRFRHRALQDDVAPVAFQFFQQLGGRNLEGVLQ